MQPVGWYVRRLRGMSAGEIAWRVRSMVRDGTDRVRFAVGDPMLPAQPAAPPLPWAPIRLSDVAVGEWAEAPAGSREAAWRDALGARGDHLARHELSFFDLAHRHLGDPIDWNRDHSMGKASPMGFAPAIDYRDKDAAGDAKLVWEPSRHHHLVVLGRAYRATGAIRYAAAVVEQLESWLDQCPFGRGMQWRSPLELAIRLINWTWAIDLIQESGLLTGPLRERFLRSLYLHVWEVRRKYSRGSSANNHRIGEAAGVYVATAYFPELSALKAWREEALAMVAEEILVQTYEDGCTREQAFGYHVFVLQFILATAVMARARGDGLPDASWRRLEAMLGFASALAEGGPPPYFGDADDGYVLDLGGTPLRAVLAVGAVLCRRPDLKVTAREGEEAVRWMLGRAALSEFDAYAPPRDTELGPRAFPGSGHYLLQCGHFGMDDRISVLFDCGELGFGAIAAHGHADALSVCLRVGGRDVLADPGTYDYFTHPAWREHFRTTRAHNTLEVDGLDQSVLAGPFLWGQRAEARCLSWEPGRPVMRVSAEHDGYTRLRDPVVHRRHLELDEAARTLVIRDQIVAEGDHEVALHFQLGEDCVSSALGDAARILSLPGVRITLRFDPRLTIEERRGNEHPIAGWVSRGYHVKVPATLLVARGRFTGGCTLVSTVELERNPDSGLAVPALQG